MDILSSEATAWLRAHEEGVLELPAKINELIGIKAQLDAQIGSLQKPEKVPAIATLIAKGTPVDKASKEHEKLEAEAARRDELLKGSWQARSLIWRKLNIAFAAERGNLIMALRPVVDALITEARPIAQSLASFAPGYNGDAVIRHGTPEQVTEWRTSIELERRFGFCISAWRHAWNATQAPGGHPSPEQVSDFSPGWIAPFPPSFHSLKPGESGWHAVTQADLFWTLPERVLDARLGGRYYAPNFSRSSMPEPTILGIANERPECGFRLATCKEMSDLFYERNEVARHERSHRQEQRSRRVMSV